MDGQDINDINDVNVGVGVGTENMSRKATPSVHENYTEPKEMFAQIGDDPMQDPNVKGEKTIVCWNCQTVLMVKEDWNVVQCTNCDKINRIPNAPNDVNNQIKVNDNLNHFDLYLPYVVRKKELIIVYYYYLPFL